VVFFAVIVQGWQKIVNCWLIYWLIYFPFLKSIVLLHNSFDFVVPRLVRGIQCHPEVCFLHRRISCLSRRSLATLGMTRVRTGSRGQAAGRRGQINYATTSFQRETLKFRQLVLRRLCLRAKPCGHRRE